MSEEAKYDPLREGEADVYIEPAPPPCDECGSATVECSISGRDGLTFTVPGTGLFFPTSSGITALVCMNCGFAKLYATDPWALRPKEKGR